MEVSWITRIADHSKPFCNNTDEDVNLFMVKPMCVQTLDWSRMFPSQLEENRVDPDVATESVQRWSTSLSNSFSAACQTFSKHFVLDLFPWYSPLWLCLFLIFLSLSPPPSWLILSTENKSLALQYGRSLDSVCVFVACTVSVCALFMWGGGW